MTKEYMFLVYRWVKSFQNSGSIFNQKIQYASKDQKQALRATNKFKDMMKFSKEDKRLKKLRILMPDKTVDELKSLLKILK